MKGMKRKFFLKRMWNFVVVMLIPALLLVAVTTYMTLVTQMHRMTQDNERGIEAVRSNISLVLDSVLAQNSYMTGMTRTNMVLNKALKRESLSYTDAIYLRSLVSSLNSMTNAYDYVDSVLIYIDGYDRALTSSGLVNLSADDYSGWYSVYSSMSDAERTCIAPVVVNAGKASERRQLVVCARMLTMEGCVAVTLNISHLQEIIAVLRPSDNQHLYLVDGSGRLLAKAGDAGATEELQNLMGKTLSGAGNTAEQEHEFWIKLDDRDCLLNWQSYQNPDFYIVSTIDRAMILENLGERLMPLLLMAVVALYAIVFLAFTNYSLGSKTAAFIGFKNFLRLFQDEVFLKSLAITLKYVLISVPLKLTFALLVAYLLTRPSRMVTFYRSLYYLPSLVGGSVAVALVWKQLFARKGLFNSVLANMDMSTINWFGNQKLALYPLILMSVWQFGSSMIIFAAGLKEIPVSYYEAARIDGARGYQSFFRITLPCLSPIILYNLIMQTISAFMAFTQAMIITNGGPNNSTMLYALYVYNQAFKYNDMGYACAMSWFMLVVMGLITFIIFKTSKFWVFSEAN